MRRTPIPLVLLLLTPLVAFGQVRDQAGFFSPDAARRADQLIGQLRQQTGHTLLVDTLPSVPADQQSQLQSVGKDRFFQQYTAQRAKQAGISGVYVLITRDPAHLQVAVGNETARAGLFTAADRDRLRDSLLADFRAKNYDQGLLDAVSLTQRTMTANRAAPGGSANNGTLQSFPAPGGRGATATPRTTAASPRHSTFFWIVVIGGGFLLLFFVIRRLASRATSSYGPGYTRAPNAPPPLPGQPPTYGSYPGYGAGTTGGFGRGLLGGILGGAAGGWLYDRMSHRNDYPGQSQPPTPTNPDAFNPGSPDTDFSSSSGADFGDTSSDLGGGGGDFNPPDDSGGGGDF
jgi:uncharacterized membrane protein YgcG